MCCIINFFKKRKVNIEREIKQEIKGEIKGEIKEQVKEVTMRDRSQTSTVIEQPYKCRSFVEVNVK